MKLINILIFSGYILNSLAITLDCRKICHDYSRRNDFLSARSCNGALNLQPRDVHKACVKGKLLAFEQSCLPTCLDEKWRGKTETGNSFQACQDFAKKPSPNHHLSWCRKGFDDYYRKISSDIKDQVKEVIEEQMKAIEDETSSHNYQQKGEGNVIEEVQDILNETKENDSIANSLKKRHDELEETRTLLEVESKNKTEMDQKVTALEDTKIAQKSNHDTFKVEEPSKKQFEVKIQGDEAINPTIQEIEPIEDDPFDTIETKIVLSDTDPIETTKTDNYTMIINSQTDSIFVQKNTDELHDDVLSVFPNEF
jgi:hypothetical protein